MNFLKFIMADRGLSQPILSRDTGINQARVSLLANNRVKPSQSEKAALEAYFEKPTELILGDIDDGTE